MSHPSFTHYPYRVLFHGYDVNASLDIDTLDHASEQTERVDFDGHCNRALFALTGNENVPAVAYYTATKYGKRITSRQKAIPTKTEWDADNIKAGYLIVFHGENLDYEKDWFEARQRIKLSDYMNGIPAVGISGATVFEVQGDISTMVAGMFMGQWLSGMCPSQESVRLNAKVMSSLGHGKEATIAELLGSSARDTPLLAKAESFLVSDSKETVRLSKECPCPIGMTTQIAIAKAVAQTLREEQEALAAIYNEANPDTAKPAVPKGAEEKRWPKKIKYYGERTYKAEDGRLFVFKAQAETYQKQLDFQKAYDGNELYLKQQTEYAAPRDMTAIDYGYVAPSDITNWMSEHPEVAQLAAKAAGITK